MVRFAYLAVEKIRKSVNSLAAMERGGVKMCGVANVLVLLELSTGRMQIERCGTSHVCLVFCGWSFFVLSGSR